MSRKKFQKLRLALFANSYCAKHLADILKTKHAENRVKTLREISLLAHALNLKKRLLLEIIIKGKYFRKTINSMFFLYPKDAIEIPIFLAIEKEMIEITDNKFMQNLLEVEDYTGGILSSAIERTTGNKLNNVTDDNEFNIKLLELSNIHRRYYYRVVYRYKLPTIRILPFILRLISSY